MQKESPTAESYSKVFGSELTDYIEFEKVRPWMNFADLNHFVILVLLCALSVLKVGLHFENKLFITFDVELGKLFTNGLVFDSQEVVTHSPRLLSIFTMCLFGRMKFTAKKDTWCAVQF